MTTSTNKINSSLVVLLLAVLLLSPAVLSAAAAAAASSLSSLSSSSSGGCQHCAATGDCTAAFRNGPGQYCGTWHEYTAVPGSPVINKPCCCPTTYQCQVSTYQCLCHDPMYLDSSSTNTRTNKRNNNKNRYKYEGGHNYSGEDTAEGIWGWILLAGVLWWCCCRRRNTHRNRNQEQAHYVHPPAVPCQHNKNNPPAYNPNAVPPVYSTAPIDYGATTTTPVAAPTVLYSDTNITNTTTTNGFVAAAVGAVTGGLIGNLIGRHQQHQRTNIRDGSGNIFGDAEGGDIVGDSGGGRGGGGWGHTIAGDSGGGGGGRWEGDITGDS